MPESSTTARSALRALVDPPDDGNEAYAGQRAATRNRLLDACSAIIVRDGFSKVSMTSIADEAAMTRQTVYRYFPNAREAVTATMMRTARELLEGQLMALREQGAPGELIIQAVMTGLRLTRHNELLRRLWAMDAYPRPMLTMSLDPVFLERGAEALAPIARRVGWSASETEEAYEVMTRTVMSLLTVPPRDGDGAALRGLLERRLLPALGLSPAPGADR